MAFNRARRHLSTLASGSKNRKVKAKKQTRSTSGSTIYKTCSNYLGSTGENLVARSRKDRQSITFDKLLTNDEFHEALALAPTGKGPPASGSYSRARTEEFAGHQNRVASLDASEKLPSLPQDRFTYNPGAPSEPLPSGTSSRRTTIWDGKPDISSQNLRQRQANDETRLETEQSYYECVGPEGRNRRRSMLRSVSRDDYLLARGANPRTGLVTPGVHGASTLFEETELLKQRGIVPPPKWRQRGDQWVSLDIGESSPLSSPSNRLKKHQTGQPLRTPPRLTAGKYNHVAGSRTAHQRPIVSATLPEDLPTPDGVPGTFPITPYGDLSSSLTAKKPGPGALIRRKPLASTPETSGRQVPSDLVTQHQQESTDTVIKRSLATALRSSSAPVPRDYNFETPDDIGKDSSKALPSVPNVQKHSNIYSDQPPKSRGPFLDHQQPREAKLAPASRTSALSRQDKELPCLPMSSGQYPLQASAPPMTTIYHDKTAAHSKPRRTIGPRGSDPTYPFVRNTRMTVPQRRYQIGMNTSTGTRFGTPLMSVPTYDNPPSHIAMPPKPIRGTIGGPRPMHQPRSASQNIKKASSVFIGPPITISTNTSIPIHMSTPQPIPPGGSHRVTLGSEASHEPGFHQYSHERVYQNDPRSWNRGMSSDMLTAMPTDGPCAQSRPQMPDRADAHMRSVPRMIPQRSNRLGSTDAHRLRRTTGTGERACSEMSETTAASIAKRELDRVIVPSPLWPPHVVQNVAAPVNFRKEEDLNKLSTDTMFGGAEQADHSSQISGLTRSCNRCQNGSVVGSLHSIAGQGPPSATATVTEQGDQQTNVKIQQQPLKYGPAVMGATEALNSPIIEEEMDERDHTACCTECCTTEDCHEGCLGHPSLSVHSFDGFTIVDASSAPSSPDHCSPSVPVPSSTAFSPPKGKLLFVQGLRMRKTLRTRQCPDDGKTIKERCNGLDSPTIELDSHPLSPGSFWGDGQGALAAAKKAIGTSVWAASTPKIGESAASDAKGSNERASPPRLVVQKFRGLRSRDTSESGNSILPSRAPKNRDVSAASNPSANSNASKSRNVSGASALSIEIPHIISSLGTINGAGLLEMLRVPFEAAAMWLQTHPEFKQWLWKGVEKAMNMARTVVDTSGTVWEVSYVYSKTGKWRCKAPGGIGRLLVDCGRSVGYLLVFGAVALCLGRVLGCVLGLVQGLFWVIGTVGWFLKRLGLGILW